MTELLDRLHEIIFNPFVLPFIVLSLWICISFSSARASGWNKLKEKFRYNKDIKDVEYFIGGGKFLKTGRFGSLRIGLCNDGIIIKQIMRILLFQPALLFPWSEISYITISEPEKSVFNVLEQDLRAKISRETLYAQTAEISFHDYHDMKIIFPWQKAYRVFMPKDLNIIGNV